jgi:formate hydrogenlyase subunit 3/multisubunit Na+/H+ antiporter MnhD subunit
MVALIGRFLPVARIMLFFGCLAGVAAAISGLPEGGAAVVLPTSLAGQAVTFCMDPGGFWLLGFGLLPAGFACALATPSTSGMAGWLFGAAVSLIGALGVFGLQNGAAFLIAWEVMSLGGAIMILSERLASRVGRPVLFMLALLEVGAVALMLAILILSSAGRSFVFDSYNVAASSLSLSGLIVVGILFLIGFGAKLGLLPFFEWFPGVYSAGSGASGTLMSGVVMNAAFFGLSRSLLDWVPGQHADAAAALGVIVVTVGVFSAILTALYAFQEEDWRSLLSFSSAENASIAVAMLGAAMMFRAGGHSDLASLAWIVSLLHLAGHALAKSGLFLTADIVYRSIGRYEIAQSGLLGRSSWIFGLGTLFAAMSLAAMPPQAGFVSEWYVFQTVFQGFNLDSLSGRLVMALAGAGLALTAALSFATFLKLFGIGLLGRSVRKDNPLPAMAQIAVGVLGVCVLALAVGMPAWLNGLSEAVTSKLGTRAALSMYDGVLLVPLTAKFAFISPTLLVLVMPLLAIIPVAFYFASRRYAVRRVPVWYGGLEQDPSRSSTTALAFSNAMRTFYSFIYRPIEKTERETEGTGYFVHRLVFTHDVAPFFGPYLFRPATKAVLALANKLRVLQSGNLNSYLALIGGLLVMILALVLF